MKSRKKSKREYPAPQLEMTPMIDVVFQLLIFFVVTLKQEDLLSRLDVNRPAPPPPIDNPTPPDIKLMDVVVSKDGYSLMGTKCTLEEIDRQTATMSALSKKSSIVIRCMTDSPHARLIRVLDILSKNELTENINVFTIVAQ